ncbi:hypothetical protein AHAS_Ahas14G0024500 [Arachis hypogaea]
MILLALVVTNGFGLRKIPQRVVPQFCPNDCVTFIFICHPKVPTCVNGKCVCVGLDNNNNSSTKQERHNDKDGEKSKLLG